MGGGGAQQTVASRRTVSFSSWDRKILRYTTAEHGQHRASVLIPPLGLQAGCHRPRPSGQQGYQHLHLPSGNQRPSWSRSVVTVWRGHLGWRKRPEEHLLFFPFLSSFCGSGGWRRCNPKMSTGYHKGTALGRDKCTWSVTWALGSKFRKSSQLEGETWKKGHAWRTKREVTRFPFPQEIRVLHREAAESTQPAGDRCCHPGWSAVFLRMYSCFPIYYPPSYLHLLPPSTPYARASCAFTLGEKEKQRMVALFYASLEGMALNLPEAKSAHGVGE